MKVSIIIPIYNAERYLKECLDSIAKQHYKNFEVILINDGSLDKSQTICEERCMNDRRFKLVNQKNSGVSVARNNGIKNSKGDIILFVDADDELVDNALEIIVNNINDNDLLVFAYFKKYKNCQQLMINPKSTSKSTYSVNEMGDSVIIDNTIGGYVFNKVFRKEIINDNHLFFDSSIHYCEDLMFVIQYLKCCTRVSYIPKALYLYRMRKSSVTYNFINAKNVSILAAYENLIQKQTNETPLVNSLKFNYIMNYYKLKKVIPEGFNVNYKLLNEEKQIIKSANLNGKIKYVIIKDFHFLFKILRALKIKKLKLFD